MRQGFTGYEKDGETGLNFAQARYQSPTQGRFTSVDPLRGSGIAWNPQSWNRYTYCLNNPLTYIDPMGLIWLTTDYKNYHWVDDDKYDPAQWEGYETVNAGSVTYFGEGWGGMQDEYKDLLGGYVSLNADGTLSAARDPNEDIGYDDAAEPEQEISVNPTKMLVATGNFVNAGRLYASGGLKFAAAAGLQVAPGAGTAGSVVTTALGTWNIMGANAAFARGRQQWNESVNEKWSDATWKNFYGVLPFGQRYDDPSEPGAKAFWRQKLTDFYKRPIEFINEIGTAGV